MNRSAIAAVGLSLAVLSGCSQTPQPSPPPASEDALTTTSDNSEVTSEAPEKPAVTEEPEADGPPKMPKAAAEHTEAGAEAFVKYYIDTLNAAHMELVSVDDLRSLASDSCQTCKSFAEALDAEPFGHHYIEFVNANPVLIADEAVVETNVEQVSDGTEVGIVFTLDWGDSKWLVSKIQSAH